MRSSAALVCCLALGQKDVVSGNPFGLQCRQAMWRGVARTLGGRGCAPAQGVRSCSISTRALGGAGFSGRAHFWAFWPLLRVAHAAPAARSVGTRGMAACTLALALALARAAWLRAPSPS